MKVHRDIVRCIKRGGIGVMPTDTIYGLVGSALAPATVGRIYRVRRRERRKPLIVLIASPMDVRKFGVKPDARTHKLLTKLWHGPGSENSTAERKRRGARRGRVSTTGGPVSIILPCPSAKFRYLHRGTRSIAFRVPKPAWLRALLRATGPLVAPSANPAGRKPATTRGEAYAYFKGNVDFYIDGGTRKGLPSSLIEIKR